ncbi:unnamed protein product [Enterobius vermicularis]|uniref:LRRCT domain-containing protein n=1 Tax=Enterobius vermicularis TaxID=51028 RepID=A0A0N4UUJ7_ENTVE|nr:unnamed protein product [Enterobius vermicularis]
MTTPKVGFDDPLEKFSSSNAFRIPNSSVTMLLSSYCILAFIVMMLDVHRVCGIAIVCPCGCRCKSSRIDCSQTLCRLTPPSRFSERTTHLDLSENNLEFIPENVIIKNNKLRLLSENRIENLTTNEFSSLSGVVSVNLRRNGIVHLPDTHYIVTTIHHIKTLDLSENLIEVLEAYTFAAFPTLTNLNLSYNNLFAIHRDAFIELLEMPSALFRYLRGNQLMQIESLTFRPLTGLVNLDLSHCLITTFGDGTFLDVNKLKTLNLTHNRIEKIGGWLFGLNSLLTIDLSYNNIEELDDGEASMWTLVTTLEWVSLAHNRVPYVPTTFKILKRLKYLYLNHNQIRSVAGDAFLGLNQLLRLDLSGNLLNEFFENGEAFDGSKLSLKELAIAANDISVVSVRMFEHIGRIETLDVDQNPISVIEENAFEGHDLRNLSNKKRSFKKSVGLQLNLKQKSAKLLIINTSSMVCDCNIKWFHEWIRLSNISQAAIRIKCSYPKKNNGTDLFDLKDSFLTCDSPYVNNFPPHPQLLDHSETLIKTTVGETQKLTCNVTGATPLNIEWNVYHNGQKSLASQSVENFYADIHSLTHSRTLELQNDFIRTYLYSELILKNVSVDDEGEYRCSARNSYGAVHSPRIKFATVEEPVLVVLPENVTADIGSTVTFRCAARGRPLPVLKWQKQGGTMYAAEEKRLHVKPDEDSFYITEVKKTDEGLYKCVAENFLGRAEASALLIVRGKSINFDVRSGFIHRTYYYMHQFGV